MKKQKLIRNGFLVFAILFQIVLVLVSSLYLPVRSLAFLLVGLTGAFSVAALSIALLTTPVKGDET